MCSLKIPSGASASACTLCLLETNSYIPSVYSECVEALIKNNKLEITCKFKKNSIIFFK